MHKLSIVIVTLDCAKDIEVCLQSIFKQNTRKVEVVIQDNGSKDRTIETVKKFPRVKLVPGSKNLGFALGNDKAARVATGDVLFFLNPDTKLSPNFIAQYRLVTKDIDFTKKIIVPTQFTYDGKKFLHCGLGMDILGFPVNQNEENKFFYADGAGIIISKIDFFKLGAFDPDYFIFQEDVGLAWAARLMNFKFLRFPELVIFHRSGGYVDRKNEKSKNELSSNLFRRYYGERNIYQNLLKYYRWYNLIWVLPVVLGLNIAEITLFVLSGNINAAKTYFKIYDWLLKNRKKIFEKRKFIQRKRVVSDFQVMKSMYKGSGKLSLFKKFGLPTVHS